MTNSFAVVGSRAASFSSVLQCRNSCFADGKYIHRILRSFTYRILLIGVINFFPVGTAVAVCRIFPINFSIRLNGTPFFMRTILCSSASIALCFSRASLMHRVVTSTIQYSTSFLISHWHSPDSNLFLDIGSCPLCPDTFWSGNMLWIPWSIALDKWSNFAKSLVCAMCINHRKITPAWSKIVFPPIELRTYYTNLSPTSSHFQGLVVLIFYFSWMDAPEVYQHICESIILIRHVLFLTPHGRSKDTISIPFAEQTVLPTRLVLLDDLSGHRQSSILIKIHTPFFRTHL